MKLSWKLHWKKFYRLRLQRHIKTFSHWIDGTVAGECKSQQPVRKHNGINHKTQTEGAGLVLVEYDWADSAG